jgi:NDP-mannose synthase
MRALVLAGGLGRRLAPLTTVFPKPLAPIGEMPILEIVLRQLHWYGVREVIISIGYLGELIEAYLSTRSALPGLRISYLRETVPLGTAGPIGLLEERDQDLLVVNGDILTTLDFGRIVAYHRERQPALTVGVHARTMTVDLGVLELGAADRVQAYVEKPSFVYQCSMGVNVYAPSAIRAIEAGEVLDFPALVERLLSRGEAVLAYRADCYWQDIGRRDDYEQAVAEFDRMRDLLLPGEPARPNGVGPNPVLAPLP